jgi:hypothetical protein
LGIETEEQKISWMKKNFAKLSAKEQEKVEAAYHRMNPEDFNVVTTAAQQSPTAIRLPSRLVDKLRRRAYPSHLGSRFEG